ncbi:MAG TPA: T9SS type A sorting domain-containing protein [Saprospiraceae bacterium]|nr:T9SS type A sorting domain-containing protein [Saprospiraceae bacterium]
MKAKYLCTFLCFALTCSLIAQSKVTGKVPVVPNPQPAPYLRTALLPQEQYLPEPENPSPITNPAVSYRDDEVVALTTWDAQGYGCMTSRIYADGDGNPVATWIHATDLGGANGTFAERGTGYNVRTPAGTWPSVTGRIETVRTGFPAATRLDDGTEIVVAHYTGVTPYRIHVSRKAPGATTWTETDLENPVGAGCLWPHISVGGQDGKTVHVIAITTPKANGGTLYQGVDAQLLYWRSTDGGLTWDKKHVIIPGLDNTKILSLQADQYTVDANGETVGIAIFPDWNDLMLFKSYDNGGTWEQTIVNDFPDGVENYVGFPGNSYDIDDIGYIDPNTPDTNHLAVFSSDGFGSLLIDDGAQAHIWFGYMYYIDTNFADSTSSYYPGMNGLCYWKESWGTDNFKIITGALDYNGDTVLNVTGGLAAIGPYYNNLASFATTGIDDNGVIYLVYAAFHELYRSDWGAEKDQYYRHLYAMKSADNGDNWSEPYELTAPPYISEDFVPYIESVWPAIPRHIDNGKVWVLYQQDGTPGTERWGANHAAAESSINWFAVPTDDIPAFVSVFNPPAADEAFDLVLSPNPAATSVQLSATFEGNNPAIVEVFDAMGRLVQQYRLPQNGAGRQTLTVPVQQLQTGTYSVRVTQDGRFGITKLLKI